MPLAPRPPEVLSPAGDPSAVRAAIAGGADAVYFGVHAFNARARAKNFGLDDLAPTMALLHAHGRRGYVTLNTLVFEDELDEVEAIIRACAAAGVDAIIVQDPAVFQLVRAIAPSLRVHASTQLTCTDASAVAFAAALGAERVTLARELSLDEVASIARVSEVELEVFVHGALCISYSGQCLTSEAIGGRSANRGACAQACRLPYELVVDGAPRQLGERAFLLSPQDLEASSLVPALVELGVRALKIEGRLKGPDYVGATARLYRQAADAACGRGAPPDLEQRASALQTFTRGSGLGFLGGPAHHQLVEGRGSDHRGLEIGELVGLHEREGATWLELRLTRAIALGDGLLVEGGHAGAGELGGRVWGLLVSGGPRERAEGGERALVWLGPEARAGAVRAGRRVFRSGDPTGQRALRSALEQRPYRQPLDLRVSGVLGGPALLEARAHDGRTASAVIVETLTTATGAAPDGDRIREKLARLGDSPFELGVLAVDLPADAFLPASALNRARRDVVSRLAAAAVRTHPTTRVSARQLLSALQLPSPREVPGGLFVLCRSREQADAALDAGADGLILDLPELADTGELLSTLRARSSRPLGVALARVRKPGEERLDRRLLARSVDSVLVRSLGSLQDLAGKSGEAALVGDFSLNVTNPLSAATLLGRGLTAFTPAHELDARQLVALLSGPLAAHAEVVIHHAMPLFHSEHCLFAALLSTGSDRRSCGRPCDDHQISLRDRAGMAHPVLADVGCRNTVFHSAAQSAARLVPTLRGAGVRRFRLELVRETPEEVLRLVAGYRGLVHGELEPGILLERLKREGALVGGSLRIVRD